MFGLTSGVSFPH